jgi:hypothetical protein
MSIIKFLRPGATASLIGKNIQKPTCVVIFIPYRKKLLTFGL